MYRRFQTLNGHNLDVEKRWNKKQKRDLQSRSRQTGNATFSSLLSLKLRYENWSRGSIWRLPVVVNVLLNWLSNDSENKTANVLDVKLSGLVNILSRLKRRKMILYVSVNSDKPDFFAFLVFYGWFNFCQRKVVFRTVARQDNILPSQKVE